MILLDTNILLRIIEPAHPMHQTAVDALVVLTQAKETICIVPQTLYEFWVVATRPRAHNGLGLPPAAAHAYCTGFVAVYHFLNDSTALFGEWQSLVLRTATTGKTAHDARLVAAMTVHGITRLLTFNANNFQRFAGITVLTPADILTPPPTTP